MVYVVCGLFTGLAAIAYAAVTPTVQPGTGAGLEMDAIASAVIGGTLLSGGVGTVVGTLFGVLIKAGKDRSQRKECGCLQSKDIGVYDTCLHGCTYCYAGTLQSGLRNRLRHSSEAPQLLGEAFSNN